MNTLNIAEIEKLEQERMNCVSSYKQCRIALELARAVRELSLLRRGGRPFTRVTEELNRLRQERDLELSIGDAPRD